MSPSSATLVRDGEQVSLTAGGGEPPYYWSVIDLSRGMIDGVTQGVTIVYQRVSVGDNVVVLRDSAGKLGVDDRSIA